MKIAILGIKGVTGYHGVQAVADSLLPHLAARGPERGEPARRKSR